jgi:hypothetical protein
MKEFFRRIYGVLYGVVCLLFSFRQLYFNMKYFSFSPAVANTVKRRGKKSFAFCETMLCYVLFPVAKTNDRVEHEENVRQFFFLLVGHSSVMINSVL